MSLVSLAGKVSYSCFGYFIGKTTTKINELLTAPFREHEPGVLQSEHIGHFPKKNTEMAELLRLGILINVDIENCC